jgi:cytoskeleton protein RodZ
MSDEAVVVPSPASGDVTAGMLLRQAREATGLHVAALAVSMKVPVKKLEALEADRLQELPDAVFTRALAASVCRTLKVDAAPILNKLPQSMIPRLDQSERGISMPTRGSNFLSGSSVRVVASRSTVLLVVALLLGALGVLLLPENYDGARLFQLPRALLGDSGVALPSASGVEAVTPVFADKPVAPASAPVAVSVQVPPAPAPLVELTQATSASTAVSPDASSAPSGLLVFRATSRAWIRVSDSHGVVQFEKTLAAGESAVAPGVPPLAVIVGNVAATEVLLRGQPFALEPVTQNNVARFEVK